MSKTKRIYACSQCGAEFPKWVGQCKQCQAWNTLIEESVVVQVKHQQRQGFAAEQDE